MIEVQPERCICEPCLDNTEVKCNPLFAILEIWQGYLRQHADGVS